MEVSAGESLRLVREGLRDRPAPVLADGEDLQIKETRDQAAPRLLDVAEPLLGASGRAGGPPEPILCGVCGDSC